MSNEYYRPQGFTYLPEVTKNLLIINGIFFLAQIVLENTFGIELSDYLGLHYFGSEKFRPFQFITYMFLHGNFQHILFNMFALWMFGYAIENYWGGKKVSCLLSDLWCWSSANTLHYLLVSSSTLHYSYERVPTIAIRTTFAATNLSVYRRKFFTAKHIRNKYVHQRIQSNVCRIATKSIRIF